MKLVAWFLHLFGLMTRKEHEAFAERMNQRFLVQETAWELACELAHQKDGKMAELKTKHDVLDLACAKLRFEKRALQEELDSERDYISKHDLMADDFSEDLSVEELFDISGVETADITRSERAHAAKAA
jgi:hypothetical protein